MNMKKCLPILVCLFMLTNSLYGLAETVPFDDPRWEIKGDKTSVMTFDGKQVLYTPGGGATIKDTGFIDGIIEVDMLFPDDTRGFSGITWREQDGGFYEHFYIRPHLSGETDSTQYTPVFNHDSGWQLYFGPQHSVALDLHYNKWMHIKIVVSGDQAEIYVDDKEPILFINDLKADLGTGSIGVSTTFAPAYYANFSYEKIDKPTLKGSPIPAKKAAADLVTQFDISEVVADGHSKPSDYSGNWSIEKTETSGTLNISRYRKRSKGNNTVLVRLNINSEVDQIKRFSFGYSDEVIVYINNKPVSGGSNVYRSRDYRYLGSIGLFDNVYIPLKAGKNEVYFAVKEYFGGWGFMGKFDDMTGITLPTEIR